MRQAKDSSGTAATRMPPPSGRKTRATIACVGVLLLVLSLLFAAAGVATAAPAAAEGVHMAPLNAAYLSSALHPTAGMFLTGVPGRVAGMRPTPQDLTASKGVQVSSAAAKAAKAPTSYDLRTLSRVSVVKDQADFGTCWAFATMGSLESCLLKTPQDESDFSEDNLVLNSGFDLGGTSYKQLYDAGGNMAMSTAYLARWNGPVDESQDPYGDSNTSIIDPVKHVQEVDWIPVRASATDNGNIKNAVVQYGGVYVSMQWVDSCYKASTAAYYYSGVQTLNHAVVVVGWDDSYSAKNFAKVPRGNGAFIVKNSWGTSFGKEGYFYVSYYDSSFARADTSAVFLNAEANTNYSDIYQYDPLGDVTSVGYRRSNTGWFANVFTADATSTVSAVGFYTLSPGTGYEVYTGTGPSVSLTTRTKSASGTAAYMGYHTITLTTPLDIDAGSPFWVEVKVTSPGTTYPIAVEYPLAGYSLAATAGADQSFVSSTGTAWSDLTASIADTNVCLKAYTR